MKNIIYSVIVVAMLSVSGIVLIKNESEKQIARAVNGVVYMYKNQILNHELENHYTIVSKGGNNEIKNSYIHVLKTIEAFKITRDLEGFESKNIYHDYVVLLFEFANYLNSEGLYDKENIINDKIKVILEGGMFLPSLKINYEIKDLQSLRKYVTDLKSLRGAKAPDH